MTFDRHLIEAKLALTKIGPEEMPALAWDALEADCDGPAVRRLAALDNPSGWLVDQVLPAFMQESGLERISKEEACLRLARQLAERILSEGLDPIAYTRDFRLLYFEGDYPREMQDVGLLDDEKDVAECMGGSDSEFREYARGVLASLIESDPDRDGGGPRGARES